MKQKIYILHGWAYTSDKWEPLVSLLRKKGYTVELLKIPGLTAPLEEVWKLDNYVDWLKTVLVHEKNITLIGHSNGGRISLAFAAKYPDKVDQLFLIDSAGIYHDELPIRIKRFIFGRAAKVGKMFTQSKNFRAILYRFSREHDYEQANPIVRETMLNLIKTDLQKVMPSLNIPTVIIWGKDDRVTPLDDGKKISELIKGSKLYTVTGARHSPMFTHTHEVADIILSNL